MPNTYLTKTLSTPSTTGVGSISSAATPVITFNTSTFGSQRRLSFWSSAVALSSQSVVTIVGTMEGGLPITESITPSTVVNTINLTTQDFLSVTSISINGVPNSIVNIGTSSLGSSPWHPTNTCATPFNIGFALTYSSSAAAQTFGAVEYAFDDITPFFRAGQTFIPTLPIVSTALSTTGGAATGKIDFPVTAWRLTIDSTANVPIAVSLAAVPVGLGS